MSAVGPRGVFLGTSGFAATVLGVLAGSDHRPTLVVTLPDRKQGRGRKVSPSPVALAAEELGIEVFKCDDVNAEDARGRLLAAGGQWASICAFGQIIKEPLLTDLPMLNVHPSLLPRWRGAAPIERSIMAGDEETGVCVMRLVAGLDSGPVASSRATPIGFQENFESLSGRLAEVGGELLVEALDAAAEGTLEWVEQDDDQATYAEKIDSGDRRLDLKRGAWELDCQVRALTPHIGAWMELQGGDRLGISEAAAVEKSVIPGIAEAVEGELLIGCGEGALRLSKVQPPGKKPMDADDYLRGYGVPVPAFEDQ